MKRRTVLRALGAGSVMAGSGAIWAPAMAQEADMAIEDMIVGSADAPVELIEYVSFSCGACARFHSESYPTLRADYIDQGQVRLVYREFFRNQLDLWATMVARCAGPVRYFGVTDILLERQAEWTAGDAATVAENLRRIGRTVGMSDEELEACLTDGEFAMALVDRQETFLAEHEIPGTPTFYINGDMHRNSTYTNLASAIDEAIADAQG